MPSRQCSTVVRVIPPSVCCPSRRFYFRYVQLRMRSPTGLCSWTNFIYIIHCWSACYRTSSRSDAAPLCWWHADPVSVDLPTPVFVATTAWALASSTSLNGRRQIDCNSIRPKWKSYDAGRRFNDKPLVIGYVIVQPAPAVRNVGVMTDSDLTMRIQVGQLVARC